MNTVMARLTDVTVSYGGIVAMNRVSFEVPAQGIMALIGPNGAGKTTAFNVLSGHVPPGSGTAEVFGAPVTGPAGLADRGLARSWQDGRAFQTMTAMENLVVAVRCPRAESPFWRLVRPGHGARLERDLVLRAAEVLDSLGLTEFRDTQASDLGYAEQRLLGIGRLLVRRPKLLLLDEPAAGLDGASIDRVVEIVRDFAANGTPVVIVEHSLSVVRSLADTCVFMSNGEAIAHGTPDELLERDELIDMYFGKGWRA